MHNAHRAIIALAIAAPLTYAASPTTNPAQPEQEAFAQLHNPDELISQQDFDLDTAPLDATVANYIEQRRPVLALLHQAATMPNADWGEPADMQRQLDDLSVARTAVRLTWLAARFDAANGRPAQAIDELLAGVAVSRHMGQRKLLICYLVECACESGAIDRLAKLLPSLPNDVVEALPGRLGALPPSSGLAGTIEGEHAFALRIMPQQLNAMAAAAPKTPPPADATPRAQAEAAERQAAQSKQIAAGNALATAQMNAAAPFYDAVKKAAPQPPAEFETCVKAAAAAMPGNMIVQTLAPTLQRSRINSAVVEAKQAMLRTAVAIALHGDGELATHKDPFGDGAFRRDVRAGGYDLTGTLMNRGKPLTLRVGQ